MDIVLESYVIDLDPSMIAFESSIREKLGNSPLGQKIKKLFRLKSSGAQQEANELATEIKSECNEMKQTAAKSKNSKIKRALLVIAGAALAAVATIMTIKFVKTNKQLKSTISELVDANKRADDSEARNRDLEGILDSTKQAAKFASERADYSDKKREEAESRASTIYRQWEDSQRDLSETQRELRLEKADNATTQETLNKVQRELYEFQYGRAELRKLLRDNDGRLSIEGSAVQTRLEDSNNFRRQSNKKAKEKGENNQYEEADMRSVLKYLGL